ncbi:hypothetical protein N9O88_00405, partial [bacterium]|nr:hypothetical protein [bacterium]
MRISKQRILKILNSKKQTVKREKKRKKKEKANNISSNHKKKINLRRKTIKLKQKGGAEATITTEQAIAEATITTEQAIAAAETALKNNKKRLKKLKYDYYNPKSKKSSIIDQLKSLIEQSTLND